jgi:hypothetical protein
VQLGASSPQMDYVLTARSPHALSPSSSALWAAELVEGRAGRPDAQALLAEDAIEPLNEGLLILLVQSGGPNA